MAKLIQTTLDFASSGAKVTGLPTPTLASDAAPKSYADSASAAAVLTYRGLVLPQTRTLIGAMTNEPRRTLTFLYDDLITSLIDAGVWSNLVALYILAAPDSQAAGLNLVNPTGVTLLSSVNVPVFTAYRGYAGDGTSSYLQTQIQADAAVLYTQNSGTIGVVSRTNIASTTNIDLGTVNLQTTRLNSGPTATTMLARINESAGTTGPTTAGSIGFFAASRTSSTNVNLFAGTGAAAAPTMTTTTLASANVPQGNAFALFKSANAFGSRQLSAAFIGAGLTQAQMNALYTALKTFLNSTTVGAWL